MVDKGFECSTDSFYRWTTLARTLVIVTRVQGDGELFIYHLVGILGLLHYVLVDVCFGNPHFSIHVIHKFIEVVLLHLIQAFGSIPSVRVGDSIRARHVRVRWGIVNDVGVLL